MKKLALVLALFLLGCLPLHWPGKGMLKTKSGLDVGWKKAAMPVLLVVHPDAWQWKEAIEDACTAWNRAVGFTVVLNLGVSEAANELKGSKESGIVTVHPRPHQEMLAWVIYSADEVTGYLSRAAVYIPVDALHTEEAKLVIAKHELGHVLGLAHDPNTCSIMYSKAHLEQDITEEDAKQLRERYGG